MYLTSIVQVICIRHIWAKISNATFKKTKTTESPRSQQRPNFTTATKIIKTLLQFLKRMTPSSTVRKLGD